MSDPARIARLAAAGVERVVFWLPARGPAAIEKAFDRYTAAAQAFTRAGS